MLHATAPGLRRAGFGALLLGWQIEAGLVAGIASMTLEVRAREAGAIAFYRALGFEPGATVRRYYAGREDALRMRLAPLAPPAPPRPSPPPPGANP